MIPMRENNEIEEREDILSTSKTDQGNIFDLIRNVTNFASLLRVCGAMIMLAAMSSYLMQGWASGNDISRYYMLLSQTFLLALSGFGLSFILKENKGARIFFGLGLVSVTVNMTTLGALIFSTTQWGSTLVQYPEFAKWVAPASDEILMAVIATLAVSAPVAWVAHKVLARRSANILSGLFLFTNLMLLVPARESVFVGLIALIAVIIPVVLLLDRIQKDSTLRTPEGFFAMATIFVPAGIITFRSVWLYPVDDILQIILAGTAFIALRFCAEQTEQQSKARALTHWLSAAAALAIALPAASLADQYLPGELALNVLGLVLAGLLLDISTRCKKPHALTRLALSILILSHLAPVMVVDDLSNALLCIVTGMIASYVAHAYGMRFLMIMGVLTTFSGITRPVVELMQWIDFSNWITLSISGAVIIIAASLIERHGAIIKMKWDSLATNVKSEQA